jgi:hypothetical protein
MSNPDRAIRQYLTDRRRKLCIFSIGQVIGSSIDDYDFRQRFSDFEGAVAAGLDDRFAGWKPGITQSMAIKPAEVWELLDGVIVQ